MTRFEDESERPWIGQYILNDRGDPVPERDPLTWARWLESHDRRLALTTFAWGSVSTVFLGLDHNFMRRLEDDPLGYRPVLWETMVFGGPLDQEQCRYSSREEALAGHRAVVEAVKARAECEDDRVSMESLGVDDGSAGKIGVRPR